VIDISKLLQGKNLTETEENVLRYIIENIDEVMDMGVRGIAKNNYTSTSTIMRLTKKMGYTGFIDMHYRLLPLVKNAETSTISDMSFINSFTSNTLLEYNKYEDLKYFSNRLHQLKNKFIFIYATGFSSIAAEYIYKKFLVLGKKCILATGMDSVGVFENNLEDIGLFIVVSRSGETKLVADKAQTARENHIFMVSLTNEADNTISRLANLKFRIKDDNKLDDRNMMPNTFFADLIMLIELFVYEYYKILLEE